jgi:hypothetical protein
MGVVSCISLSRSASASALETKPGGRKIETGDAGFGPQLIRAEKEHQA